MLDRRGTRGAGFAAGTTFLAVALAGCGGTQLEKAADAAGALEDRIAAFSALRPAESREPRRTVVRIERRPWLGLKEIAAEAAPRLPEELRGKNGITLTLGGEGTEDELAKRIETLTGIAVRFAGLPLGDGGDGVFELLQTDGLSPAGEVWEGPLDALFDAWAEHGGYEWRYDAAANEVVVVRSRAVNFQVHALSGEQSYKTATSTSEVADGGGASRATFQTVETEAAYNPWEDIQKQLAVVTSEVAQVEVSQSSGTVLVRGTPRDIAAARKYLAYLNEHRLLPVTLSVHVYSVEIADEADYSLGIFATIARLFGENLSLSLSPTGGAIVRAEGLDDSLAATVAALSSAGKVARVLSADIPSLNGLPAQFFELFKTAYLKETKTTATESGFQTELTTDTVSSGFAVSFTPQITAPGEVLIRLVASVQDRPTFAVFTSADQSIQLPSYGSRAVHLTQRLARGETLLITGFSDRAASTSRSGTFAAAVPFPGGGRQGADSRAEQVLLVTAEVGAPLGVSEVPGAAL